MSDRPLTVISPTRLADLLACPARVSFALQHGPRATAEGVSPVSVPARAGIVCHRVLELLVTREGLGDDDAFETAWNAALNEDTEQHAEADRLDDWRFLALTRARLRRALGRIAELLKEDPGTPMAEQTLRTANGQLVGQLDLLVRGSHHWIADLKSGRVRDHADAGAYPDYVRQLQLYAYLERQTSGEWPTHAWLVTLQGRDARVEINPHDCERVAEEAFDELSQFNAAYPANEPRPSPDKCRWCPELALCPAPWTSDMEWGEVLTARLQLTHVRQHADHAWISGEVLDGNLEVAQATIDRLSVEAHPEAAFLSPGDVVALIGLKPIERDESMFRLPSVGRLVHLEEKNTGF